MGALTEAAQQYLRLRRALGYELEEPGSSSFPLPTILTDWASRT
jgi:hypothetical protein